MLDVVDPMPHAGLTKILARYPDEHRYHPLRSLEAIPLLPAADCVLLDGDHNWYTVYHELQLLFARAIETGALPPLILLHDVAWPYARRDMYYDPGSVAERHPFARRGMVPGQSELTDDGLNGAVNNALHEGGEANGVLTAVEDFVASWPEPIALHRLPYFGGLGILVPPSRARDALQAAIEAIFNSAFLLDACDLLEREIIGLRAELSAQGSQLLRRSEALIRARTKIVELGQAREANIP